MKKRLLKVERMSRRRKWTSKKTVYPFIRLKGNWMKEAGINPGMIVNVEILDKQIIISY